MTSISYITNKADNRYVIELQIVILKLGRIDTKKGTCYVEFYMEASWSDRSEAGRRRQRLYFNPNLVFSNCVGEPLQEVSISVRENKTTTNMVEICERRKVHGVFSQKFDFAYFPMDVQTLRIEITSSHSSRECVLIESMRRVSLIRLNAFMDEQEWRLNSNSSIYLTTKITCNEFSVDQNSTLCANINVSRDSLYYLYNVVLLVFLIVLIGLSKYALKCNATEMRLILDTTITLTLVTFKWVISENEMPQIPYLTSLDKYFLFSTIFISLQTFYDSIIGVLSNGVCDDNEFGRADFWALVSSLVSLLVANVILISWISVAHLKRLRSIRQNEANLTKHTFERLLRQQLSAAAAATDAAITESQEKFNELPKIELQNNQQETISLSSFDDSQIIRI